MKRIKFIKDTNGYRTGDVVNLADEIAKDYIIAGIAIMSKDMTPRDYKTLSRTMKGKK